MSGSLQIQRFLSSMSNPQHRGVFGVSWRRKSWKEIAVGAAGVVILFLVLRSIFESSQIEKDSSLSNLTVSDLDLDLVDITLVKNAREKGAVCLDGSPPAYHFQKGFGHGSGNWLLHIEGGGWCNTETSCLSRKMTVLGSSDHMERQMPFIGILSSHRAQNPDFFNWNKVRIRYCDGASLSGDRETENQNGTILFFRGQRIWKKVMDELLSMGLANAGQALLTGCSAGGLATLIHCDNFRELLPKSATVKCLADGAFFLDEKDLSGTRTMRSFYHEVVNLQEAGKSLNKDCISHLEPSQCFFPQQIVSNIKTPLFLVNSAYDFWQIQHILAPDSSDPNNDWLNCKLNILNCNPKQIEILQGFRTAMLRALSGFEHNKDGGMFINSCFIHCQAAMANTWHSHSSPRINNKTIAETVGDWYFNRRAAKEIDCPYPCNPTCYNMFF